MLIVSALAQAPSIMTPPQNQVVSIGDTAFFSVVAEGASAGAIGWADPVGVYRWVGPTISIPNVQLSDAGTYTVWVHEAAGSATATVTLTVLSGPPQIVQNPATQTVTLGTKAWLSVQAAGTVPMSYQWYKDGAAIPDATSLAYALPDAGAADTGTYFVQVTNASGAIASSPATLTVQAPAPFAGGSGTLSDPWQIATVAQLDAVHSHLDGHFVLTADLDLNGILFNPIGAERRPFVGSFDGQAFAISNWRFSIPKTSFSYVNQPAASNFIGLFAASDGVLANLRLLNVEVDGQHYTGALVGLNHGSISHCEVSGSVTGLSVVGGLAGHTSGAVSSCTSSVVLTADTYVGGLVGSTDRTGSILDCVATGEVRGNIYGGAGIGGLVGDHKGLIQRSHASGNVEPGYTYGGGLVGDCQGRISTSYATGSVNGPGGGLAGISYGGTISNCFASGRINSGGGAHGGLLAQNWGVLKNCFSIGQVEGGTGGLVGVVPVMSTSYAIDNCFWDTETSGAWSSAAGEGRTTLELQTQATFTGWSFSTIWAIEPSQYPTLRADAALVPERVSITPERTVLYRGDSVTLTATATGTGPITYEWQVAYASAPATLVNLSSSGNGSLTLSNVQAAASGMYFATAMNSAGALRTSAEVVVNDFVRAPTITSYPSPNAIGTGESVSFTVTVQSDEPVTYQWYHDGEPIAGATANAYTIMSAVVGDVGQYHVNVTNSGGTTQSGTAYLRILLAPEFSIQPRNINKFQGSRSELNVALGDASSNLPTTYQWYHDGQIVPGAINNYLTMWPLLPEHAGSYYVVATNAYGSTGSNTATVTVRLVTTITSAPLDQYVDLGSTVSFSVGATGMQPLVYSWTFTSAGAGTGNGTWNGSDQPTLTISNVQKGDQGTYQINVSNPDGSSTAIRTVYLGVNDLPPTIVTQPQSQSVVHGSAVTFTVAAGGTAPFSFRWYRNGSPLPDAWEASYTIAAARVADSGEYTVVIDNGAGSATTNAAILTVVGTTLSGVSPASVVANGPAFELTVTGTNVLNGSVINWNGAPRSTVVSGDTATASILASDIAGLNDISTALITLATAVGELTNGLAVSIVPPSVTVIDNEAAAVNETTAVSTAPTAAGQTGVTAVFENHTEGTSTATIAVANYSADPTPSPSFEIAGQYVDVQVTGADASDRATTYFYYPSTVAGAEEDALTLMYYTGSAWMPVLSSGGVAPTKDTTDNLADASSSTVSGGRFVVILDATSTPAITDLTGTVFAIRLPSKQISKHKPAIRTQPADQTIRSGGAVTFSVVVETDGAATYQWYFDKKKGQAIAGANGATLALTNVTAADAGDYFVIVTNSKGSTTSHKARLSVLPQPPVIVQPPVSQTASVGENIAFTVNAWSETAASYQWFFKGKKIGGATAATLSLKKIGAADAGDYTVLVSNDGGSVTSPAASLTVSLAPTKTK